MYANYWYLTHSLIHNFPPPPSLPLPPTPSLSLPPPSSLLPSLSLPHFLLFFAYRSQLNFSVDGLYGPKAQILENLHQRA